MNIFGTRTGRLATRVGMAALVGAAVFSGITANAAGAAQAADTQINLAAVTSLAHNVSQGGANFAAAEAAAKNSASAQDQAAAWNARMRAAEVAALTGKPDQGTVAADETGTIFAVVTGNGQPLPGVKAILDGPSKAITTTDAQGKYMFSDVIPGAYTVWFELPNGYTYQGSPVLKFSTSLGAKNIDRSMGFNATR